MSRRVEGGQFELFTMGTRVVDKMWLSGDNVEVTDDSKVMVRNYDICIRNDTSVRYESNQELENGRCGRTGIKIFVFGCCRRSEWFECDWELWWTIVGPEITRVCDVGSWDVDDRSSEIVNVLCKIGNFDVTMGTCVVDEVLLAWIVSMVIWNWRFEGNSWIVEGGKGTRVDS